MTFPLPGANWTYLHSLRLVAATAPAGYTLVNGTGTILSWTAPADGKLHWAIAFASLSVTGAQTGGLLNFTALLPGGGQAADALFNGGQGAGNYMSFGPAAAVEPGGLVTVTQATPLTLGGAVLYAGILAL